MSVSKRKERVWQVKLFYLLTHSSLIERSESLSLCLICGGYNIDSSGNHSKTDEDEVENFSTLNASTLVGTVWHV